MNGYDLHAPAHRVGILHGAGYVGAELIALVDAHPALERAATTSRTFAGRPIAAAHPALAGRHAGTFAAPDDIDVEALDAVLIAAEHGQGAPAVEGLLAAGFDGAIVDLSADFRLPADEHQAHYGSAHAAPELLESFVYGLPEVFPHGSRRVANPGCFATALSLALWPLARAGRRVDACVTAWTGASGSGARPGVGTHFPTRDGNARAYRALEHRHVPEVLRVLGSEAHVAFVPVSGPWTRGIWGTAHLPGLQMDADALGACYADAYATAPFVRLHPGGLPELAWSVRTPFVDVGWVVRDGDVVVGFGLDNLLKGAASQAIQNLNRALALPETLGLLPHAAAMIGAPV